MSRERQRARAVRDAVRAAEVAAAARSRARSQYWARLRPSMPSAGVRRRRRYGALPTRAAAALWAGWFAVQVLLWQFVDPLSTRFSLAVLTAAALLVLITTRRSTPR